MKWSTCHERGTRKKNLSPQQDSNLQPPKPRAGTLSWPLELRRTHKERGHKLGSYSYAKHTKLKTSRTNNIRAGSVFFLATVAMGVDVTAYDGSLPKPKQQFSAEKGIQSNHLDNSCA